MIDADIKKFVLRMLVLKDEPVSAREIKLRIRGAFTANFPEAELDTLIAALEESNHISGMRDDLTEESLWALTNKGRIQAQNLIKK